MGSSDDGKKITRTLAMDNLSLSIPTNKISRDLLQRFMGSAAEIDTVSEEDEGIELNLGLSLGGRFGVDKSSSKLRRSSSIASCLPIVRDDNSEAVAYAGLARTSSLPLEAEEEWRKRKEWQTLRRMEAKRRRSEKQRSLKAEKGGEGNGGSRSSGLELTGEIDLNLRESGMDVIVVKGKGRSVGPEGKYGVGNWISQGSGESKGGSFSGAPDMGSKFTRGSSNEPSPPDLQSMQERSSNVDSTSSGSKSRESTNTTTGPKPELSPYKKSSTSTTTQGRPKTAKKSLEDMPCVFTRGDGPNGRRVEGILYKYGKGQEVRIMCICHGTFHSPAEFVTHAGGTDVDHPLKHIVVNRNSSSSLL